jgi:hypothetical protein
MHPVVLAAMVVPMAATYLLLQPARHAGLSRVLATGLAVGIGLGLASATFFVALVLFDGRRAGVLACDGLLLLGSGLVWWRAGADDRAPSPPWSASERLLAVAVVVAAGAAALSFLANTRDLPHGRWDAWATWNLRARQLARAGAAWPAIFPRPTLHGDYPLLLPATVARLWVYAGAEPLAVPALVGAAYAGALVLVLYGAVAALRGRAQALVGALCLLGTPLFLRVAPWQYADVPLAFNLLAAMALLALHDRASVRGQPALVWAGLATGLAAWTKNEGMMLALGIVAVRGTMMAVRRTPDWRAVRAFATGMLSPALLVIYFKLALAPGSRRFGRATSSMLSRLLDLDRYAVVLRGAGLEFGRGLLVIVLGLAVYGLLLGRTADRGVRALARPMLAVLLVAAAGYTAIYVVTPIDIAWYVGRSVDRIELQMWPAALLALLLYLATPGERAAASGAPAGAAARRPARAARRRRQRRAR